MSAIALVVRFALEVALLAAVAATGWAAPFTRLTRAVLALAGAGVVALVWGLFLSPKRSREVGSAGRLAIEISLFGCAAAALAACGHARLGAALLIVWIVDTPMLRITEAEDRHRR